MEFDEKNRGQMKAKQCLELILDLLPRQPRSLNVEDDPGFWSNGNEILCSSETESEIVAEFLRDLFSEFIAIDVHTGYYEPDENQKNREQDATTGFYYVNFD